MRKITFIIIAIGVILFLQCCASADKKPRELEGVLLGQSELEKLFSKNRNFSSYDNTSRSTMRMEMSPNGMQMITWLKEDGEHRESISGTYMIRNGQKCNTFAGQEKCWKIYKISDDKYYVECTDGSEFGYMSTY